VPPVRAARAVLPTQALTHSLLSEITRAPANRLFDTSCFNGTYVTGDVDDDYFAKIQAERTDAAQAMRNAKFLGTVAVANVGADELATDGTPDPSCPSSCWMHENVCVLTVGNDGALMNTPRGSG